MTPQFNNFVKSFIKENYSRDNFYSWLSPSGEFHIFNDSHGEWAEKYLNKKGIDKGSSESFGSVLNYMFKRGWFRITRYGDDIYCHNPFIKPSGKPLKELIDSAIENNMRLIKWDNEDDERIIWVNEEY